MSVTNEPWYADIVNYLATDKVSMHWTTQDKYQFFFQVKYFIWDDPYLFKQYPDIIISEGSVHRIEAWISKIIMKSQPNLNPRNTLLDVKAYKAYI